MNLEDKLKETQDELALARAALRDVLDAVGGASTPNVTTQFLSHVPAEVRSVVSGLQNALVDTLDVVGPRPDRPYSMTKLFSTPDVVRERIGGCVEQLSSEIEHRQALQETVNRLQESEIALLTIIRDAFMALPATGSTLAFDGRNLVPHVKDLAEKYVSQAASYVAFAEVVCVAKRSLEKALNNAW